MLCGRGVLDQFTNTTTLIDIVEVIQVGGTSAAINEISLKMKEAPIHFSRPICVVSLWRRSDPEVGEIGETRAEVIDPTGKKLKESSAVTIDLRKAPSFRSFVNLAELPVTGPGEYHVRVSYRAESGKWKRVEDVPLDVAFQVAGE
jgi:hypothetical protein